LNNRRQGDQRENKPGWYDGFRRQTERRDRLVLLILLAVSTAGTIFESMITDHSSFHLLILRAIVLVWSYSVILLSIRPGWNLDFQILLCGLPHLMTFPYLFMIQPTRAGFYIWLLAAAAAGTALCFAYTVRPFTWYLLTGGFTASCLFCFAAFSPSQPGELILLGGSALLFLYFLFPFINRNRFCLIRDNILLRQENESRKDELSYYSEYDSLIRVFNKRGGIKILRQTMKWSQRYDIPLTICYLDLNSSGGDQPDLHRRLLSVSRSIYGRIRQSDTVCRLGDDELLIILPDCCRNDAESVITHIRSCLKSRPEEPEGSMESFDYGLADYCAESVKSPNELIINADRARSENCREQVIPAAGL